MAIESVTAAPHMSPGLRATVTTIAPDPRITWVLKLRSRFHAAAMPAAANDSRDRKDWFFMHLPIVAAAVFTLAVLTSQSIAAAPAAPPANPGFDKAMIVVLENTNYDAAAQQPFLASLARRGALLTNLSAEGHPSQPNYLALIAGSTFGLTSDRNVDLDGRQIGDLLEAKGLQWKIYAEGFPGNCFLGVKKGDYVRKHAPFLSFRSVQSDPARCARVVDATQLGQDVQNGSLPNFSLYVPDLKHDGHDTGVAVADGWLAKTFGPLLDDPRFTKGLLLVVTFDEGEHFALLPSTNRVFTVLVGDAVAAGSISNAAYSHYSLLRTIEDGLGVGTLGRNDGAAAPFTGIWRAPAP
jgi:hypothetical protein